MTRDELEAQMRHYRQLDADEVVFTEVTRSGPPRDLTARDVAELLETKLVTLDELERQVRHYRQLEQRDPDEVVMIAVSRTGPPRDLTARDVADLLEANVTAMNPPSGHEPPEAA